MKNTFFFNLVLFLFVSCASPGYYVRYYIKKPERIILSINNVDDMEKAKWRNAFEKNGYDVLLDEEIRTYKRVVSQEHGANVYSRVMENGGYFYLYKVSFSKENSWNKTFNLKITDLSDAKIIATYNIKFWQTDSVEEFIQNLESTFLKPIIYKN